MQGFDPKGVARMLGIGLDARREKSSDQDKADRLAAMLHNILPAGPPDDKTYAQVLLGDDAALGELRQVKDRSRDLSRRPGAEDERVAAVAIYYAAIARALVLHGQKITQYSYKELGERFAKLAGKPWLPPELTAILAEASEVCRGRSR